MSTKIVKYHNDLNEVVMRKWTPEEMDFFFSVVAEVREKGCRLVTFCSDDLKELSRFADRHKQRWLDTMESVAKKALDLKYIERSQNKLSVMNLFSYFDIDGETRNVEVEVSSKFEYVVNKLEAHFTQYELAEFTSIRSTYAKTAYRLLKQWRTVGRRKFEIDDFKTLMAMPKSYKSSEIDRAVIKPILKELSPYFVGLKCKKHKSKKRGNPVLAYEFTWQAEITEAYDPDKYKKLKEAEKVNKAIEKAKNRKTNVPEWANEEVKNEWTDEDLKNMAILKLKMLSKDADLSTEEQREVVFNHIFGTIKDEAHAKRLTDEFIFENGEFSGIQTAIDDFI